MYPHLKQQASGVSGLSHLDTATSNTSVDDGSDKKRILPAGAPEAPIPRPRAPKTRPSPGFAPSPQLGPCQLDPTSLALELLSTSLSPGPPVACRRACVRSTCACAHSLTFLHVVDGGEMLEAAAHHAALSPQLWALSGRRRGAGGRAGHILLGGGGL